MRPTSLFVVICSDNIKKSQTNDSTSHRLPNLFFFFFRSLFLYFLSNENFILCVLSIENDFSEKPKIMLENSTIVYKYVMGLVFFTLLVATSHFLIISFNRNVFPFAKNCNALVFLVNISDFLCLDI